MSIPAATRISSPPASFADVAVLIPCLNEAASIASVVAAFQAALPGARIYVTDNNSTDDTAAVALAAGADVSFEPRAGKGWVMRRMFAEIEADVFVMVDGDGTYDATCAPELVAHLRQTQSAMVIANRVSPPDFMERRGHRMGNAVFSRAVTILFRQKVGDVFSGYRALTRRLVKSFPAQAKGFEIETDLTVHCLDLGLPVTEVDATYRPRGDDVSRSKLRTLPDGFKIARRIVSLFRNARPMAFFFILGIIATLAAWGVGAVVLEEYLSTGRVLHIPSAILATGLQIVGIVLFTIGAVLDSVATGRREQKLLAYLNAPNSNRG